MGNNLRDIVPVAVSVLMLMGVVVAGALGMLELAELGAWFVRQ